MGKRDASVFGSDRKWEIIAKGYNLGRGSLGNWSSLSTMVMGTETVLEAALALGQEQCKGRPKIPDGLFCWISSRLHVLLPLSLCPKPQKAATGKCCSSRAAHTNVRG